MEKPKTLLKNSNYKLIFGKKIDNKISFKFNESRILCDQYITKEKITKKCLCNMNFELITNKCQPCNAKSCSNCHSECATCEGTDYYHCKTCPKFKILIHDKGNTHGICQFSCKNKFISLVDNTLTFSTSELRKVYNIGNISPLDDVLPIQER